MRSLPLLLALACSPAPTPPPHLDVLRDLTVVVDAACAGVITAPSEVTTAGHCIEDASGASIEARDGRVFSGAVTAIAPVSDLGWLAVSEASWPQAATWTEPELGEDVAIVHHTDGGWSWSHSRILELAPSEARLDGLVSPGMSGSPVFRWGSEGALLCIVTGYGTTSGTSYCGRI